MNAPFLVTPTTVLHDYDCSTEVECDPAVLVNDVLFAYANGELLACARIDVHEAVAMGAIGVRVTDEDYWCANEAWDEAARIALVLLQNKLAPASGGGA